MQTPRLPPLDALLTFESAARHLSFTRAAAERFVTQSAVSRQIKTLEDELGVALFRRGHRSLALTEAGAALHDDCRAAFERLRAGVSRARATAARRVLTITTTPGLASLWLIPRLAAFTRGRPGVDVHIDASLEKRTLENAGIDLAIRYGPSAEMPGVRLFGEEAQPVCSPALLAPGRPPLRVPADLAGHVLLRYVPAEGPILAAEWQSWLEAAGVPDLTPAASLGFTQYDSTIAAALLGQGVAMGRRPLIDDLLRDGRLVTPFAGTLASPRAFHLIVSARSAADPDVRALAHWLREQAATTPTD